MIALALIVVVVAGLALLRRYVALLLAQCRGATALTRGRRARRWYERQRNASQWMRASQAPAPAAAGRFRPTKLVFPVHQPRRPQQWL